MDALELLTEQHREVSQLFERLRSAPGQDERVRLLGRLAEVLTLHAAIEERHFYPLLEAHGLPEGAAQARREYEEVRELVGRLMELEQHAPEIQQVLGRLEVAVKEHVSSEERDLFLWARGRIGDEERRAAGEAMAGTMDALRDEALLKLAEHRASLDVPGSGG
jgi:hemerythrin superfamily protein